MKRLLLAVALFTLPMLACTITPEIEGILALIQFEIVTTIQEDGSGVVELSIGSNEKKENGEYLVECTDDQLEDLPPGAILVEEVVDDLRWCRIQIPFSSLVELGGLFQESADNADENSGLQLQPNCLLIRDDVLYYDISLISDAGEETTDTGDGAGTTDTSFVIPYTVIAPGPIELHNAADRQGNILTWNMITATDGFRINLAAGDSCPDGLTLDFHIMPDGSGDAILTAPFLRTAAEILLLQGAMETAGWTTSLDDEDEQFMKVVGIQSFTAASIDDVLKSVPGLAGSASTASLAVDADTEQHTLDLSLDMSQYAGYWTTTLGELPTPWMYVRVTPSGSVQEATGDWLGTTPPLQLHWNPAVSPEQMAASLISVQGPGDGDADGVLDDADLCPNTATDRPVDSDGCPIAPTDVVTTTSVITATSAVTTTPALTTTSAITVTPAVTTTPALTTTPVITAAPAVTATPALTTTSVITATSAITTTPAVTTTPVITAAPAVTATPVITTTSGAAGPPQPVGDDGFALDLVPAGEVLGSFSAFQTAELLDATGDLQSLQMEVSYIATDGPFGFDELFELHSNMRGPGAPPADMQVYLVGEVVAALVDDAWTVLPRGDSQADDLLGGMDTSLLDLGPTANFWETEVWQAGRQLNWEAVETTQVEGVSSVHYVPLDLPVETDAGTVLEMDVWVSLEDSYVVAYEATIQSAEDTIYVSSLTQKIDDDFSLTLPADMPALPDDSGQPSVSPSRSGSVLFADEFDDPESGWDVGDFDHGWVDYEEGVFVFYAYGPEDILWSQLDQSFDDTVLEVEATQVLAPANHNAAYGVACRVGADGYGGYLFLITVDGAYAILKDTVQEYVTLVDWTDSDTIRQGEVTNLLSVVCDGSSLALSVNGEQIAQVDDSQYADGDIALLAMTFEDEETETQFDNLKIMAVSPTPSDRIIQPRRPPQRGNGDTTPPDMTGVMVGPDTFPSYRMDIFVESSSVDDSGVEVFEFVDIQAAANGQPFAQQISIYMDTQEETAEVEVVQLDETIYMWSAGDGCVAETREDGFLSEPEFLDIFYMLEEFLAMDVDWQMQSNETVNGVEATHYTFDQASIPDLAEELSSLQGDIYLAVDGGHLVRLILDGQGVLPLEMMESVQDSEGQFYLEYELYDVGEPVKITSPTVCDSIGSQYPMPDDAAVVMAMEGATLYSTAMNVQDVADFYLGGMPDLGWQVDDLQSQSDEESATLVFYDSAGTQLTVSISAEGDGTEVTVVETLAE